ALATSIGAWVNFLLLLFLAARAGLIAIDASLRRALPRFAIAGAALAFALWLAAAPAAALFAPWQTLRDEATLAVLAGIGLLVYGGLILALFGRDWRARMQRPPAGPGGPP